MKTINQNGQQKVFNYHVKIKETSILHTGIRLIPKKRDYYEKYCAVLRRVIKEAKTLHNNNLIKVSANQIKATWNTTRENTGKTKKPNQNPEIKLENGIIVNGKILSYVFNDYFLKTIKNLNINDID
jgi:hypothetical protein